MAALYYCYTRVNNCMYSPMYKNLAIVQKKIICI